MSLVTPLELQKRFTLEALLGLVSDDDGALDQARVDRAIADASSEVEGYLAGRYQLPLVAVPEIIERITCDLAWYYLHGQLTPESVTKRYERALELLRALSRGDVALGPSTQGQTAPTNDGAEMSSCETVWGRSRSRGFI